MVGGKDGRQFRGQPDDPPQAGHIKKRRGEGKQAGFDQLAAALPAKGAAPGGRPVGKRVLQVGQHDPAPAGQAEKNKIPEDRGHALEDRLGEEGQGATKEFEDQKGQREET